MNYKYLFLLLPFILVSCETYYFNEPQPIDSKNIYKTPKKFIGFWDIKDPDEVVGSINIGENFYHLVTKGKETMAKSKFDSDTNTYIIDDKIYFKEDGSLKGGFNYSLNNDTIIINTIENELVEYGQKAFLRKIDYGYILNTNHEHMLDWWEIKFIDVRDKEKIVIRGIDENDVQKFPTHKPLNKQFKEYIKAKWSANEMIEFIDRGGFSSTLLELRYDEKNYKQAY